MNRREWALGTLGWVSAADLAEAWQHAHQLPSPKLQYLTPAQAAEIEALCAQIIPSDGTPGATEAGAIYFIDHALATSDRGQRDAYRTGMEEVRSAAQRLFGASASVGSLSANQVIALLQSIEKTPFFELLRTHTILGFVGPPERGGNRDGIGWTHLSMEDRMVFEPPFGYYDARER